MPAKAESYRESSLEPFARTSADALSLCNVEGRPRTLTLEDVADYLQSTTYYVRREVHAGRLRAIRIANRELRFKWEDIDEWFRAGSSIGIEERIVPAGKEER